MKERVAKKIKTAPLAPGVYIFKKKGEAIYIGKAANLHQRLKNYLDERDPKNAALAAETTTLSWRVLESPIAALILEAKLIKKFRPAFNVVFKDDKNYFYVAFSQEEFPKISLTHQPDAGYFSIGPFTDGAAIKEVLKIIRRYWPYCTCSKKHNRPCLNAQINLCLGFCCLKEFSNPKNSRMIYSKNIGKIKKFLEGKIKLPEKRKQTPREKEIIKTIEKHKPYLEKNTNLFPEGARAEGYDISHFGGQEVVGVMTVLIWRNGQWQPEPAEWRKFNIRTVKNDDPRAMAEIVSRRINHQEWSMPAVMVIDGGITQYKAAIATMDQNEWKDKVKIISFAKPAKLVYGYQQRPTNIKELPEEWQKLISQIIARTHRFAIKFHRQLYEKRFTN